MPLAERREQLEEAVRAAVAAAEQTRQTLTARASDPAPAIGDLYLFRPADEESLSLEWAVIEIDPTSAKPICIVAADDFPLTGPADVTCSPSAARRRLTLRGGIVFWVEASRFEPSLRVGRVPEEALAEVRRTREAIEEERFRLTAEQIRVDGDREYLEWMGQVTEVGLTLAQSPLRSKDVILRFADASSQPPAFLLGHLDASAPEQALAAASADPLMGEVQGALARPVEVRYLLVARLTLQVMDEGLQALFPGASPPPLFWLERRNPTPLTWQSAAEGQFWRGPLVPWDRRGRVVLLVGESLTQRRVCIQR